MVQGTVFLADGRTVTLYAEDMLMALKMATDVYHGLATRMHFKTIERGGDDSGCKVDKAGNRVAG